MTILFVHALSNADQETKDQIINIFQQPEISDEDVLTVRKLLENSGTLKFARQEVDSRIHKAQKELNRLAPSGSRDDLSMLLNWILNRKS